MEAKRSNKRKLPAILVSAVVLLVCLIFIWGFMSDWGAVTIRRNSGLTSNGKEYSYLSYIPKTASDENPLPCAIVFHGGSDNAQSFSGWQMELVRRGYVVFSLDENGTTYSDTGIINDNLCVEFTNMVKALPFVDSEKIITAGHSMGGMYSVIAVQECGIAGCIDAHGDSGGPSLRKELTFTGGNMAFIFGDADIFCGIARGEEPATSKFYATAFGVDASQIQEDVPVGSLEDGTYKVVHFQEGNGSHPCARWNADVIATVCKYAGIFAPTNTTLEPTNQLYQVMFFVSMIGVAAFFALVVCVMLELMKLPFFAGIKRPMPQYMGVTGKSFAASAALTMLPTIPLYLLLCYFTAKFTTLSKGTAFLPVGRLNQFILFLVAQGLWDTVTFFLSFHRKKKLAFHEYGLAWEGDLKYNLIQVGKTALLAAITAAFALTFLDLLDRQFGLSFTSWWMGIRSVDFQRVQQCSGYLVPFFFVFLGAQFGSNIVRRLKSTGNETRDMIRDILVNCLIGGSMICLLFIFQVITQNSGIFINLINRTVQTHQFYGYSMAVMCTQAINTVCYRKTGSIWPGLILLVILFSYLLPGGYPIAFAG